LGAARKVQTFNANGDRTELIGYNWDPQTSEWLGNYRSASEYDTDGNQTVSIWYNWYSGINDWVGDDSIVSTYDANGNRTEAVIYEWDLETNYWVASGHSFFEYDANGNQTKYMHYNWDSITNDWVGQYHWFSTYDANGHETGYIRSWWDLDMNDWLYSLKSVSYWSELTTSIPNNFIDLNYIIYPNPFTDYTTIKLSDAEKIQKIELIDIHGRTVRSIDNANSNSVTIHRQNLPSGIYFIRIQSDDTYVKKVIIR
jgi:hypothetical protein